MFGRSAVGTGGAGRADVEFRANVGKFRADVSEARQVYQRSTAQMSDSALRMAIAQEKLDRAIHKYGAESRQAKQATLAYRSEMRALEGQADRTGRELDQTFRRASTGTGIFRSLGRSVAFVTAGLLGAGGLVFALRSTFNAAKEAQTVEGQLEAALKAQNVSWQENREEIERTIRAHSRLAAIDDEELAQAFTVLFRRTGDVTEAMRLLGIVTEVTRGRQKGLADGLNIVLKASLGQIGALRRAGIEVEKNATATEALALLQRKYAGSVKAYADDAAAAQDRWNVSLENAQEIVGTEVLPALTDLLNKGAEHLDQMADSGELQEKVNRAVRDGATFVNALGDALSLLNTAIVEPLRKLGLLDDVITAVLVVGLVRKAGLGAIAIRAIGAASALAARQVAANSAVMVGSLNGVMAAAMRASAATATVGAGGAVGAGGRLRGALGAFGMTPVGAILTGAALLGYFGIKSGRKAAISPAEFQRLREAAGRGEISHEQLASFPSWALSDSQRNELRRLIAVANARPPRGAPPRPDDRAGIRGPGAVAAENAARDPAASGGTRRTLADIELDIVRARAAGNRVQEAGFLRELLRRHQAQIANLEKRKHLTVAQQQRLRELYGDLLSTQSQLDGIAAEGERKLEEQRAASEAKKKAAAEKRKAALEAERKRMDRVLDAAEKTAERRRELFEGVAGRSGSRAGLRALSQRGVKPTLEALARQRAESERSMTAAEMKAFVVTAMSSMQGTMNQFGGNLFAQGSLQVAGTPNPELYSMVTELREQTALLGGLISSARHPGTRNARTEFALAFDGPTF